MQINMGCGCSGPTDGNINDNIEDNNNAVDNRTMQEIYEEIKMYTFAAQDTALYLDTHPKDTVVLDRHNEYSKKLKEANEAYEKFNNPIDNTGISTGFWQYIEGPWAAQNMDWEEDK